MAYTMRSEEKPCRSQTVKTLEEYKCRYSGCDKVCRSKTGLIQHERRIHRIKNNDNFTCTKCTKSFKEKHNLSNHEKTCVGGTPGECPGCGKVLAPSYIKKHLKMYCKNPPPTRTDCCCTGAIHWQQEKKGMHKVRSQNNLKQLV